MKKNEIKNEELKKEIKINIVDFMKETRSKLKEINYALDEFREKEGIKLYICPHYNLDIFSTKHPLEVSVYLCATEDKQQVACIKDIVAIEADKEAIKLYPKQLDKIIEFIKNLEI